MTPSDLRRHRFLLHTQRRMRNGVSILLTLGTAALASAVAFYLNA